MPEEDSPLIVTREFTLPQEVYFKLLLIHRFETDNTLSLFSNGIMVLLMVPFAMSFILHLSLEVTLLGFFITLGFYVLLVFYPLYIIWRHVHSPENRNIFTSRRVEFSREFVSGFVHDGSFGKNRLDNIIKAVHTSEYFLLYLADDQYIYLPVAAFYSEDDMAHLKELLKTHNIPFQRQKTIS